jgi:CO/xanthine dehydrogenase Mo-binding subunit
LARITGRTVVIENTRQEEMATCLCRENAEILIRSAVTADGEIAGREAVVLMDCGAYGGEQIFLSTMTAHTLGGNYRVGAMRLVSRAVYTNTPPNGAFRACNGVYNTSLWNAIRTRFARRWASIRWTSARRTCWATATSARPGRSSKAMC